MIDTPPMFASLILISRLRPGPVRLRLRAVEAAMPWQTDEPVS